MVFNTLPFFLFFPLVATLFFLLPHRFRWPFLLAASCYFYMFLIPEYILVLAFLISVDYVAGIRIEKSTGRARRAWLIGSIASTCLILFGFKYFSFFNANLSRLAGIIGWNYSQETLSLVLPVGLSFHTFQSLSYVIDVYTGRQKAERHLGIYALFVMFFPQLVAGPIERAKNLLPQFRKEVHFDPGLASSGLKLMLWGLFKKSVIADRLGILVDQVYGSSDVHSGGMLLLATLFFQFQVYCDFSGYSDIARGAARVMGFELSKNFEFPLMVRSIGEYWRRWHISLYEWLRDYIYRPMRARMNFHGAAYICIILTLLASGIWHGASWNFVLWGLVNGLYLAGYRLILPFIKSLSDKIGAGSAGFAFGLAGTVLTFFLVSLSRVLYRSADLGQAYAIYRSIAAWMVSLPMRIFAPALDFRDSGPRALPGLTLIGTLIFLEILQRQGIAQWVLFRASPQVRWTACYVLLLLWFFLGEFGSAKFIYFQF